MPFRIEHGDDRVALVTGASRGLGCAFAKTLASRGFHVVATARTSGALDELTASIEAAGGSASSMAADITSADAMQRLCRGVYEQWGRLDMFVHAAVHSPPLSPVAHGGADDLEVALQVNCQATARLIEYVEPLLKLAGTSTAIFFDHETAGRKFHGAYGSSKACQIALARSWQQEAGKRSGIDIRILKPRPMATSTRLRFQPGADRSKLAAPSDEAVRLLDEVLK